MNSLTEVSRGVIENGTRTVQYRVRLNEDGTCPDAVLELLTSHRLTLQAFHPNPAPDIYTHVGHRDGNPKNGRLENLHWVTGQMYEIERGIAI